MRGGRDYSTNTWSGDWSILGTLLPYFMEYKWRVTAAMICLIAAKLATVALPFVLKQIVDSLDQAAAMVITLPLMALLFYGFLRFSTILLGEIRDSIFGRVTENAMRRIALTVFNHLHSLDLDFHLSRRTGGLSRDIERGTNGISFLMRFLLFNILPTLLEIAMVAVILLYNYGPIFSLIILVSVTVYILFSVLVTDWRNRYVRAVNEMDSLSSTYALDSLLNFETVKYFNNEKYESEQFNNNLHKLEAARMQNRVSLAALNSGQAIIISASMTLIMILAARRVVDETMTLGDLVLVNAYMIQLFMPLNFLGFVYREIKRALADVEHMFSLLKQSPSVKDLPGAGEFSMGRGEIRFENVSFSYNNERQILSNITFTIPAGKKYALVGPSGSGKSTIARLLFRFYDPDCGQIKIDNQNINIVTQDSLRRTIGIVPQDTVLFNNTIFYNIAYGSPGSPENEIKNAARLAHLEEFISQLPAGYDTMVGERGLKVSGGEKQRIAIARMLLKDPVIMVFDEATSSLDSTAEQAILQALREISLNKTTLVVAHRLSTIVDADGILVIRHGRLVEQGTHQELLEYGGVYARMWELQQHRAEYNHMHGHLQEEQDKATAPS